MNSLFVYNSNYEHTKTISVPSGIVDMCLSQKYLVVNSFINQVQTIDIEGQDSEPKVMAERPCDSW